MTIHTATHQIIAKFKATELHAARSGREVMNALAQVATDSPAPNLDALAAEIEDNIDAILEVMPAYAPPLNVLHQVTSWVEHATADQATVAELKTIFLEGSEAYQLWSEDARARIAQYGANILPQAGVVFTYTLSETVLRTLREAWKGGKQFRVLITESRPNNDGLITAEMLSQDGLPVGISVDACTGELVAQADMMMVGAEAIMADGSAICKVGTYPSALMAKTYGVPVFVVVDTMKFNITSSLGLSLWLDAVERSDVVETGTHERADVIGSVFDRTPSDLIRGIVTEKGILSPAACTAVMRAMRLSRSLGTKLSAWADQKH
jgi:translation initiation factor 2B subunit (eIF-2B alpha/beta/delta family)